MSARGFHRESRMCLDGRAHIFVFFFACASVKFMDVRVTCFPLRASSDSLWLFSLPPLLWVNDWHDLHSNYLSMRSPRLAVF